MHTKEQPTIEFRITAVCTVTDLAERQRRLAEVYDVIINPDRRKRIAPAAEPSAAAQPVD